MGPRFLKADLREPMCKVLGTACGSSTDTAVETVQTATPRDVLQLYKAWIAVGSFVIFLFNSHLRAYVF